jgi:hypothetical protein
LKTYHRPRSIEVRWTDAFHVDVVANGMDKVSVLKRYDKPQWGDISIRIVLDNEISR